MFSTRLEARLQRRRDIARNGVGGGKAMIIEMSVNSAPYTFLRDAPHFYLGIQRIELAWNQLTRNSASKNVFWYVYMTVKMPFDCGARCGSRRRISDPA